MKTETRGRYARMGMLTDRTWIGSDLDAVRCTRTGMLTGLDSYEAKRFWGPQYLDGQADWPCVVHGLDGVVVPHVG